MRPVILNRKAGRIRRARIPGYEAVVAPIETMDRSLVHIYRVTLTRPWTVLFDPISSLCALYMSIVYLLLYMLFSIYREFSITPNLHTHPSLMEA